MHSKSLLCASILTMLVVVACGGSGQTTIPAAPATPAAVARASSADCLAKRTQAGYDVVLLIGQSNISGYGAYLVPGFDTTDPRISQLNQSQQVILAADPLDHPDAPFNVGRIGPGMSFARAYLKTLPQARQILLVPAAYAGSTFSNQDWNPGNHRFEAAVVRTNVALSGSPGNCLAAILWNQGESDVGRMTGAQYQTALDAMILALRGRLAGGQNEVPMMLGGFSPDWTGPVPNTEQQALLDVISSTPQRLGFTSVVSTEGLRSNLTQGLAGGAGHLDAASQRVYGVRYFDAIPIAMANTLAR